MNLLSMLCINSVHILAERTNVLLESKRASEASEENTCKLELRIDVFEGSDASIVFKIGSIVAYNRSFQSCI